MRWQGKIDLLGEGLKQTCENIVSCARPNTRKRDKRRRERAVGKPVVSETGNQTVGKAHDWQDGCIVKSNRIRRTPTSCQVVKGVPSSLDVDVDRLWSGVTSGPGPNGEDQPQDSISSLDAMVGGRWVGVWKELN